MDKTALISVIAAANLNKTSVTISVDGTDVSPDAKWVTSAALATYADAIAAAQLIADKTDAKQDEVDGAVTTLAAATTAFNPGNPLLVQPPRSLNRLSLQIK